MAKSIKRNFLYNILLNISKVIFPLITAPYVSRVLEPDGVGLFNFANTYANWFALVAALGIPYYGTREIAKIKDNINEQTRFVSEIISISIISTALCTFLMILSLSLISQLNENYVVFLIAGILLYTTPFKIDWYFSGKEEFGYITFRSLLVKILSIICLFVFVREKTDLLVYVAINSISLILNELWNFSKLYKLGIHPYLTLSGKKHIKSLLILFSSSVAISVYTILDTLMLGFMTNYDEVGYYNSATHISKSLLPIATSLAAVAMPRLSQYMKSSNWDEINLLANKSLSIVSYLCFPIAFGVISVSPVFVPLFFGEHFSGAIIPLQIVVLVVIAIGLNNLTGAQILISLGYDKLFLYSVLSGTVSNFVINLILIPSYGASGAAFASVFAETLILFVTSYFVYKQTPIRFHNKKEIICDFLCAFFFFPISYTIYQYISGWIFVFITVSVCGIIYVLLQFLLRNPSEELLINLLKTKICKNENNIK